MNEETNVVGTRFIASSTFHAYLQAHHLTILDVALAANVRLSTVWSIGQGLPIRAEHEQAVRTGLHQLTGVPFMETIAVIPPDILQMAQGPQHAGQSRLKKF